MREVSLFTGMGGGIYGSLILGWKTVAYVEKDHYCQRVIKQRQVDGWFDKGEIYGDISEFNTKYARLYRGTIDVLTGGFPCQPFSVAGKQQGTSDERYLFDEIIKTIKIIQPRRLFFENVTGLLNSDAIIEIYTSIEKLGYECKPPLVLGSADCGNIHKRERVWIYATNTSIESSNDAKPEFAIHSQQSESQLRNGNQQAFNPNDWSQRVQRSKQEAFLRKSSLSRREDLRSIEDLLSRPDIPTPIFCGMDDELPDWKQQLKAIGNGQDPIVMATAWNILESFGNEQYE